MEFTVDMFLRQRWVDPRLAFNETMNKTQSHISTLRIENNLQTKSFKKVQKLIDRSNPFDWYRQGLLKVKLNESEF